MPTVARQPKAVRSSPKGLLDGALAVHAAAKVLQARQLPEGVVPHGQLEELVKAARTERSKRGCMQGLEGSLAWCTEAARHALRRPPLRRRMGAYAAHAQRWPAAHLRRPSPSLSASTTRSATSCCSTPSGGFSPATSRSSWAGGGRRGGGRVEHTEQARNVPVQCRPSCRLEHAPRAPETSATCRPIEPSVPPLLTCSAACRPSAPSCPVPSTGCPSFARYELYTKRKVSSVALFDSRSARPATQPGVAPLPGKRRAGASTTVGGAEPRQLRPGCGAEGRFS